jgi:RNA polymerase sigma-70 factor (ECF subfamily)
MKIDFDTLLADNLATVRSIARSYTSYFEYEDLMQDICVQLWRSFKSFKGQSKIETWLFRVAINTAITYQRKEIKDRKGKEKISSLNQQRNTSDGLSEHEILCNFTEQLNDVDKAILLMYLDNFSAKQMEAVLGIKDSTIRVRISRIKSNFESQFIES